MEIYHVSAECFPAAKVGGLADVVGALPKYLNRLGHTVKVVIPGYDTVFARSHAFDHIFKGVVSLGTLDFQYEVVRESADSLGFELYQIRIPRLFDRPEVYGYEDDTERFMAFQITFLDWLTKTGAHPDIVHCHDHHTGLIPFMMQHSFCYEHFDRIPTLLTIHNAQYQGSFPFEKVHYLPEFSPTSKGYLEWNGMINPLASAIKCVSMITTVSPSYLDEMGEHANGLENLLRFERGKSIGILNGIDTEVWNPETDEMLDFHYNHDTYQKGKTQNKVALCEHGGLDPDLPVFSFIGRFVYEKGADLLPEICRRVLSEFQGRANILILGSGDPEVEEYLRAMSKLYLENFHVHIGYNEKLAHLVYAGSDFLLMPSRVEPCGLNQMYAFRYGTVPIVRRTGGLRDTVLDMGDGGFGICHDQTSVDDVIWSVNRALDLFANDEKFGDIRQNGMQIDHSWNSVASQYLKQYLNLKK